MGRKILVFFVIMLSCAVFPSMADLPRSTHDGRGGTKCPDWAGKPEIQLCSPSLIRLIARAEEYDGKYIKLSGYLLDNKGIYYLCPARDLCGDNDWSAAIQLPKSAQLNELTGKGLSVHRVIVIGKFSATTRGRFGQVGGIFLDIDRAFSSKSP